VTGLVVVDTGTHFTLFGQLVILTLIQMGGLGIMTMSTFFAATVLGRRVTIKNKIIIQDSLDSVKKANALYLLRYIVIFTIVLEALGAFALFLSFYKVHSMNYIFAIKAAVFHSISAFCNAGFSLFSNSLEGFSGDYITMTIIMTLIILGGLGFTVLEEVRERFFINFKRRLSLHAKMVITTTVVAIVIGLLVIFLADSATAMRNLGFVGKMFNSLFQSITTRTAGFDTINIARFSNITLFVMIILMFIGASPGSTGGGIKTTTFAVLYHAVKAIVRGKKNVTAYKRTIPYGVVNRALAILFISLALVFFFAAVLLVTEQSKVFADPAHGDFIKLFFEVVSAFGTVGLSTGITSSLSAAGKIVIVMAMFIGRLGPLTIALALAKEYKVAIKYPEENVMVG